ncbi:hypothetical protein RBB50_002129 [Rhinocladiella similis]
MSLPWKRLIRFRARDGRILRGEPVLPTEDYDLGSLPVTPDLKAKVIVGSDIFDRSGATRLSEEIVTVDEVLGPLERAEVPLLRCIGLNYKAHIAETGRPPPPLPSLFVKPRHCVHDHGAEVVIPPMCQDDQADYEGELCFIICKDAKNVPLDKATDYIGAYTCGNDISSRKWQRDPKLAGSLPQWTYGKSFDTYAPLGPCLVSSEAMTDPSKLWLTTTVNGEQRQSSSVGDLLFDCAYLVHFFSQGQTLEKGTVFMTGTPGGVGDRMQPPQYLKPGDVVTVTISRIGTLRNGIKYE